MKIINEVFKSRPTDRRSPQEEAIFDRLEELQIPHIRVDHDSADNMEDCLKVEALLGSKICKNLFLCNRQQTEFYLLMMPGEKIFKTKFLSSQLGCARLSFADETHMEKFLHTVPGSVSALELLFDGMIGENTLSLYVKLREENRESAKDIADRIVQKAKGLDCEVNVSSSMMDMSAFTTPGIQVCIKGEDLSQLKKMNRQICSILENIEGIETIDNGMDKNAKDLSVTVSKNMAVKNNLSVAQVYQKISQDMTNEEEVSDVTINSVHYPLVVQRDPSDVLTQKKLKNLVFDEQGRVLLSDIAKIEEEDSLENINHEQYQRCLYINAQIDAKHNIGLVSRDVEKELKKYRPQKGYSVELMGENETIVKTLHDLGLMMILAVALIYLIMLAQFQSFASPFIVMFTIPLAFTGGMLGLLSCGFELSSMSMLGFLVLCGIIVNNGIVFVDYTNQLRMEGYERIEALVIAGKDRMRPILMTTLTTGLALSSLAMGFGEGADMLQPMAIVIIFGLLYATVLTLFVIPVLYDIFQKKPLKQHNIEKIKESSEG